YQYTLNFDTNGGTSVESNEIYFDGATINLESFSTTKENMEFDGWYTKEDFSVSSITSITFSQNFEGLNKEENSITLYAKWRDKSKVASVVISPTSGDVSLGTIVTLSCSTENSSIFYKVGETSDYQEYTKDTKIEITTETTIFAYAICEGMLDSEITQASYTVPKSNITVTFPSYTDVEGLTIEFDEDDFTCSPIIPAGYEFVAWYVDGEICPSDDNILNYGDFDVGSHTIMLVVKYTDDNLYSVEAILKINEE
ncbi:MAG: InlB B-repeat-containing protein, partial [Treponemataceae bacterium]|nr:InlB B-repeat-containing protein [Treponemataceae bacterium]